MLLDVLPGAFPARMLLDVLTQQKLMSEVKRSLTTIGAPTSL
jgi:hypothetical protein